MAKIVLLARKGVGREGSYFSSDMDVASAYYIIRTRTYDDMRELNFLEKIISKDHHYSFAYAESFLKNRFIMGEETISKNYWYSFKYARDVIQGRFVQGEEAISRDNIINSVYKELFLS